MIYIKTFSNLSRAINSDFNFTTVRYSLHKGSETILCLKRQFTVHCQLFPVHWSSRTEARTRNSSGDEIANVNFLYDDIVQALQNAIDSCINFATDRFLQRRFTNFSEIAQCNGHHAVQGQSRSPILVPIESSYTTSY